MSCGSDTTVDTTAPNTDLNEWRAVESRALPQVTRSDARNYVVDGGGATLLFWGTDDANYTAERLDPGSDTTVSLPELPSPSRQIRYPVAADVGERDGVTRVLFSECDDHFTFADSGRCSPATPVLYTLSDEQWDEERIEIDPDIATYYGASNAFLRSDGNTRRLLLAVASPDDPNPGTRTTIRWVLLASVGSQPFRIAASGNGNPQGFCRSSSGLVAMVSDYTDVRPPLEGRIPIDRTVWATRIISVENPADAITYRDPSPDQADEAGAGGHPFCNTDHGSIWAIDTGEVFRLLDCEVQVIEEIDPNYAALEMKGATVLGTSVDDRSMVRSTRLGSGTDVVTIDVPDDHDGVHLVDPSTVIAVLDGHRVLQRDI